jgi:putative DNA primase/helicase
MRSNQQVDPYSRITEALLELNPKQSGNDFICPAHDDRHPSLGVTVKNGKVLLHCARGCATRDVLKAIGLTLADLNGKSTANRSERPPQPLPKESSLGVWMANLRKAKELLRYWTQDRGISPEVLDRYEIGWNPNAHAGTRRGAYVIPYRDEDGALLNVKARFPDDGENGKTYRLVPGQETGFLWPADQLDRSWVAICEGESDVLRCISLGIPAVTGITGAGGSEKAAHTYAPRLSGMHVVVVADADEAGRTSARKIAAIVGRYAESVRIFDPFPKRTDGSDLSDWFDRGKDGADLRDELTNLPVLDLTPSLDMPTRDFLFPKGAFNPPRLGKAAEAAANLRRGPGKSLWRYEDGLYLPDGEDWLAGYVRDVLQEDFREGRLREVRAWCKANFEGVIPTQPSIDYINVRNGILHWQDDPPRLAAHSPEIPSITRVDAVWDPDATCPAILKFLGAVLPDDSLDFLFEWIGYLLVPTSKFQRALMLEGPRDTGKSTLLLVIGSLLGERATSAHTLQSISEDRFVPADLYGRLVNIYADLDARAVQSSGKFKAIVSGDKISAEHKFGDPFTFRPFVRLVFSANEPPGTSDQSDAYYKRWLVLPMHRQFGETEQDAGLEAKLTTDDEVAGLLARSVKGLQRLWDRGHFEVPESMRLAVKKYREETDTVVAWAMEHLVFEAKGRVRVGKAFESYQEWCQQNNRLPLGKQRFKGHVVKAFPRRIRAATRDGYPVFAGAVLKP